MTKNTNIIDEILLVAQYIENNATETLSLETLAQQTKISTSYLQRKFKEILGISPKQLQNAMRIEQLKNSLKQGHNISSAIYDAGFGSTSRVYEQIDKSLGMTLSSYKKGGENEHIAFALRKTTFGHMIMAATDRGVCFVQFADNFTDLIHLLRQEFPNAMLSPTPDEMTHQLDHWMKALEANITNGTPKLHIPLHLHGTTFQLKVWKFLSNIEAGKTVTYKDVAVGINSPKAYRAAASACAANNVAILIPCHRVLRGDGKLGGYRWGIEMKSHLLDIEKNNSLNN